MGNRRDFIKISALGVGGAALVASSINMVKGSSLFASPENKSNQAIKGLRQSPSYCEMY